METPRLDKISVWTLRRVKFWALAVDGRSEVAEFLDGLRVSHFDTMVEWLKELDRIGLQDHWAGQHLFRPLRGYPGQWEVRRGDQRLMGFRVGDDVILCLHRVKHRQATDPRDLQRVARLAKEWGKQHG